MPWHRPSSATAGARSRAAPARTSSASSTTLPYGAFPRPARPRPPRAPRRLRIDRRWDRHRAQRRRLRRGGRRARQGARHRDRPHRRRPRRARRGLPRRRHVREGRRQAAHPRPRRARPALPRRLTLPPHLPLLLALRHSPALLRQDVLVHPHDRDEGRDARGQPGHRVGAGAHQGGPLRRVAPQQRRLVRLAGALLGHPHPHLALRRRASAHRRARARPPTSPSA